jgi:uncharacterized membrane protein YhaH (DUF805 family)
LRVLVATKGATEERQMTEPAQPARPGETSPRVASLLFGFRGRIGRGRYWIGIAVVIALLFLATIFLAMAMDPKGSSSGGEILVFPALLAALWVHAAVTAKRLRDMGYSAWLHLGVVVAFGGALFVGIEAAEASGGLSVFLPLIVVLVPGLADTKAADADAPAA